MSVNSAGREILQLREQLKKVTLDRAFYSDKASKMHKEIHRLSKMVWSMNGFNVGTEWDGVCDYCD